MEAYPLTWPEGWPRTPPSKQERGYAFKRYQETANGYRSSRLVTFAEARDQLYRELGLLGAKSVVVSSNHPVARDGRPVESKRRLADEGVAVYFDRAGRKLAMASDRYDNAAANLRSLGLAIEALRQLERHGGGVMIERAFTGFAQLDSPVSSARELLGVGPDADADLVEARYRRLAREHHPDRGGDPELMTRLNVARDVLLKALKH